MFGPDLCGILLALCRRMANSTHSSGSLLPWLLAVALVLSVGVNLYCLTPDYKSVRDGRVVAPSRLGLFDDDDDDEEQDSAWAALHDELRQTRQRLATCQRQVAVPSKPTSADTLAHR